MAISKVIHDGGAFEGSAVNKAIDSGTTDNRVLYAFGLAGAGHVPFSGTYNSVALNYYNNVTIAQCGVYVMYLANPASGSNTFYWTNADLGAQGSTWGMTVWDSLSVKDPHSGWEYTAAAVNPQVLTFDTFKEGQVLQLLSASRYFDTEYFYSDDGDQTVTVYATYSDDDPSVNQRGRLAWATGYHGNNIVIKNSREFTSHEMMSVGYVLHSAAGSGSKVSVVGIMLDKWKQFYDELKTPSHLPFRDKPGVWFPSRLRWDMDKYIIQKRYRELVTGKAY